MFPVRWLLRDRYESWRYAPSVSTPTLLIAAERDTVVARTSSELLLRRFKPGIAVMKTVPRVDHDTISGHKEYQALLRGAEGI